jgi:uncharacterized protein YgiM (DUF1202 family)
MAKKSESAADNAVKKTRSRRRVVVEEAIPAESDVKAEVAPEEASAEKITESRSTLYRVVLSNKDSFLNLRDGAGQEHKSIGKIREGGIVEKNGEIVETGDSFGWMPVIYDGV